MAAASQSYCLTALVSDFDDDGWPDIFVACDQTPSLLYMNQHDGTFSEEAVLRGAAFNADGKAMSGMGATAADYEHTGRPGIFRSNFSDERETLYRNRGRANSTTPPLRPAWRAIPDSSAGDAPFSISTTTDGKTCFW